MRWKSVFSLLVMECRPERTLLAAPRCLDRKHMKLLVSIVLSGILMGGLLERWSPSTRSTRRAGLPSGHAALLCGSATEETPTHEITVCPSAAGAPVIAAALAAAPPR